MPNARARSITSEPMAPVPTTPSVLPASSRPEANFVFSHFPARVLAAASATRRASAKKDKKRVLRHRDRVAAGRVHHHHALAGSGWQVDVVHPCAGPADHAQL